MPVRRTGSSTLGFAEEPSLILVKCAEYGVAIEDRGYCQSLFYQERGQVGLYRFRWWCLKKLVICYRCCYSVRLINVYPVRIGFFGSLTGSVIFGLVVGCCSLVPAPLPSCSLQLLKRSPQSSATSWRSCVELGWKCTIIFGVTKSTNQSYHYFSVSLVLRCKSGFLLRAWTPFFG